MDQGHEFTIVQDLYDEVLNNDGELELKLIKKNASIRWYCKDLETIDSFQEVLNEKGNVRRAYTRLFVGGGESIVRMAYKDVKKLLIKKPKIGFKK